jgi:glycine dehydrogenase subunit 1
MPYIPHTKADVAEMLQTIGERDISALFSEIPDALRFQQALNIPEGFNELEANRFFSTQDLPHYLNFIGAGAYEHHIPAAVWELVGRGEFMTAYTPYQAEASQGSLQLIYEYQSMMTTLTAMDVSNASLYDGATALAEAVLMAVRLEKKSALKRILMPTAVHPFYRDAVKSIVKQQGIEIVDCPFDVKTGLLDHRTLPTEPFTALVIPFPTFMGNLDDVDALTDWAHAQNALVIAVVNPMALGLLKAPGHWGQRGVDIVCGELQPFGIPLAGGGPYAGFICCRSELVRQMPGRIVGQTQDLDGKVGYVLTLQAREQHIRRSKATSNICTNQGLLVTAATIYMSLMGPQGLHDVALKSHQQMIMLMDELEKIQIKPLWSSPFFHECVFQLPCPASDVIVAMEKEGILAGYDLGKHHPSMQHCLLVCVTETKNAEDITRYVNALERALCQF